MSSLVPQQVKDNFLQSLTAYTAVLQAKVDAAEAAQAVAQTQAGISTTKATESTQASDLATSKAAEAVLAALAAYDWANKPEDVVVSNGEFSAYHHRRKAEIAAQQVLTALAGAVVFKGQWNASSNNFPTGTSAGWMYRINAGGTLTFEDAGTKVVSIGDYILKTDTGWTYIDEATDAVKTSRTINGKTLDVNIVLTPADVQAVAIADLATQAIAEAGTDDAKWMSSLKTRQALQKLGIGLTAAPVAITNIDAFDTPTGMYRTASGTTGTFPNANVANFTLIVTRVSATAINQILIYIDGNMWVRGSSGSVWTAWKGANPSQYGIGGSMVGTPTLDLNDLRTGGIWITDNVSAVNIPTGWPQARYSVIVCGSETYTTQIITNQSSTSGVDVCRMAVRRMRNLGTWSQWYEIWTSNSLVKQVSATDNTAGSVLLTGAGGLVVGNALDAGAINLNANDLINGTIHRYETTETAGVALNLPALGGTGTTQRHWIVFTYGIANRKVQEATEVFGLSTTKGRKFVRVFQDSTWSTWKYLWDTDNLVKQTTTTDSTAGSIMSVGAFGLGNVGNGIAVSDLDSTTIANGLYAINNATTGTKPAGLSSVMTLLVMRFSATAITQMVMDATGGKVFIRRYNGSSWNTWGELMSVGMFGLGGQTTDVDANTLNATGFYRATSNGPTTGNYHILHLNRASGAQSSQLAWRDVDGANQTYSRIRNSTGTWTAWVEQWNSLNLVKQSGVNDATAGRVLLVGAGGLLANAQTFSGANDANAINVTGFFRADTGILNVPASVLNGSVIANYQRDANNQYQEIFERNSDARWYRRKFDGTWQEWVKMFHSGSPISDHPELATKLEILSLQVALAI